MIELYDKEILTDQRKSSKGNQMKWHRGDMWYKADYAGYEGLAEYVISSLFRYSTLEADQYVDYFTEKIRYGRSEFCGCKSRHFLSPGDQLFTLERMFHNFAGESLYLTVFKMGSVRQRLEFLVETAERMTGIHDLGTYFCSLLTIDALFLNEDRHLHNIAFLLDAKGSYHLCPIFDNGAGLLSDTTLDYPLSQNTLELMKCVKSKTLSDDIDEQLDAAEELYGQSLKFTFGGNDLDSILENDTIYDEELKNRVRVIIMEQRRKYLYLFSG